MTCDLSLPLFLGLNWTKGQHTMNILKSLYFYESHIMPSGGKFGNLFQQVTLTTVILGDMSLMLCGPLPWGVRSLALWILVPLPDLSSVYQNYDSREDKNAKTKSHSSLSKTLKSLRLWFPPASLQITMKNRFFCCFYWLSVWGHKNVNVSPRKSTFGGLTKF